MVTLKINGEFRQLERAHNGDIGFVRIGPPLYVDPRCCREKLNASVGQRPQQRRPTLSDGD
jgi:hypothetical protein